MYDVEHEGLFAAIRSGKTINNGDYMARSTMLAILGRMVDYTGQPIDVGTGDQLAADAGPGDVRARRRAADRARQGRQVPVRHARRDEVRVSNGWKDGLEVGRKPMSDGELAVSLA